MELIVMTVHTVVLNFKAESLPKGHKLHLKDHE